MLVSSPSLFPGRLALRAGSSTLPPGSESHKEKGLYGFAGGVLQALHFEPMPTALSVAIKDHGTEYRRRGQRTDDGYLNGGKGEALKLARPHPPLGRAPCSTASSHEMCQCNTGINL